MATIVLSAVGTAVGGAIGGSVLGLSGAVLGRAVGATIGRAIDQRLLGGSEAVEQGRVDRFYLTGAAQGVPMAQTWGRVRVGSQVIWASRFTESKTISGGGKGSAPSPTVTSYSYSVSLALALCQGEISRVCRVWADGRELALSDLNLRVYRGDETQGPDPKIAAVEGASNAPAYRGTAYVVLEDLALEPFGNRVPQFSFEVIRPAVPQAGAPRDIAEAIRGVALIPGTGEYALAVTPVHYAKGYGANTSANVNSASGKSDFETSFEALTEELPAAGSVSLVVAWFGDDLRAGQCTLRPKVEQKTSEGVPMVWRSGGIGRLSADQVPQVDGRPVYGGTPADAAVIEAIGHMRAAGTHVMYYPFILMDQLDGNGLPDPWTGAADQPKLPWRGRITCDPAPGVSGTADQTAVAGTQVAAFFGSAAASDFSVFGGIVSYHGPAEWSYRRFILHQAHLCAAAGGVDAFCIGSEMRGLTQVRDGASGFPAVAQLIALAAEVRSVLPEAKISYAADWSEYFGYHPQDGSGDVLFHLDPLWGDANIDFVGVDNYLPLSDWREEEDHLDAAAGAIYAEDYLRGNVLGGKDYDWYYASPEAEAAQLRTLIADTAYGEDWVFRAKDFPGWWSNAHHDRTGGVRSETPSPWVPGSKPIWFTEVGCPAIDKGANEPNKFVDPRSSESALPAYSTGRRDDLMQAQYLRAVTSFWADPANNPVSELTGEQMIDMARAHVWAWDSRPFPQFPANGALWSDGANYTRGHWISGRIGAQSLAGVVGEICERSGVTEYDVDALWGTVRGYRVDQGGTGRSALQPLMMAYGFDAFEREGRLGFRSRTGMLDAALPQDALAQPAGSFADVTEVRAASAEISGRVQLSFTQAGADYAVQAVEAIFPDEASGPVDRLELPLVLTDAEGQEIVERWLAEARVARETASFALPPSQAGIGPGDVVSLAESGFRFRIDRAETGELARLEATRIERNVYKPLVLPERPALVAPVLPALPLFSQFLDLPILTGSDSPAAPWLAVTGDPWPGGAAVWSSPTGEGFALLDVIDRAAVVGETLTALAGAAPWMIDRGPGVQVKLSGGALSSADMTSVLAGANALAIGSGADQVWEVMQFTTATLVGDDTWELSGRLRGQAGTEPFIPQSWPAGSRVVLLDGGPQQITLTSADRGLARVYRIGPVTKGYDDASFTETTKAFDGVGLRPYAPVHLAAAESGGDLAVSWVRRTRLDGDSWQGVEVPLGETAEVYAVRVSKDGAVLREVSVTAPSWIYTAAEQAQDGATAPFEIEVAQQSDAWGTGPYARMTWNG